MAKNKNFSHMREKIISWAKDINSVSEEDRKEILDNISSLYHLVGGGDNATILMLAAQNNWVLFDAIMAVCDLDHINRLDSNGRGVLHYASLASNENIVLRNTEKLLSAGVDLPNSNQVNSIQRNISRAPKNIMGNIGRRIKGIFEMSLEDRYWSLMLSYNSTIPQSYLNNKHELYNSYNNLGYNRFNNPAFKVLRSLGKNALIAYAALLIPIIFTPLGPVFAAVAVAAAVTVGVGAFINFLSESKIAITYSSNASKKEHNVNARSQVLNAYQKNVSQPSRQMLDELKEAASHVSQVHQRPSSPQKPSTPKDAPSSTHEYGYAEYKAYLEGKGLNMVEVIGDGNCMYRALADQLGSKRIASLRKREEFAAGAKEYEEDHQFLRWISEGEKYMAGRWGETENIREFTKKTGIGIVVLSARNSKNGNEISPMIHINRFSRDKDEEVLESTEIGVIGRKKPLCLFLDAINGEGLHFNSIKGSLKDLSFEGIKETMDRHMPSEEKDKNAFPEANMMRSLLNARGKRSCSSTGTGVVR